ncbi:RecX family transcriptional regulator [Kitasatospora sp. NPDC054939]
MTQHHSKGPTGATGPDDDHGPPDWFAAVAAPGWEPVQEPAPPPEPMENWLPPEPEGRRGAADSRASAAVPIGSVAAAGAPARPKRTDRTVRTAGKTGTGRAADDPGGPVAGPPALGLVPASELPTGRRRRRTAVQEEAAPTGAPRTDDDSCAGAPYGGGRSAAVPYDEDGPGGEPYREDGAPAAGRSRRGRRTATGGNRSTRGTRGARASAATPDDGPDDHGPYADGPDGPGRYDTDPGATGPHDDGSRRDRTAGRGGSARGRAKAEETADPETRARDICLRLLTGAAKTRKQLADALRKREIPDEVAAQVLDRLEEVGLIDDAAFALAWVESRHSVRGLSRRALAQELRTRGVTGEAVERAVAQVDQDDETEAARALVERKLRSTGGLDRQVRTRRLVGVLARRGYPEGLAFRVVREVLDAEDDGGGSGADGYAEPWNDGE